MSISIIDRQASLYPISLFQPQPNDAASRYNIGAITDASIVLQVSRDTLDAVSSIVVYMQVISKDRIDVYCILTGTAGKLQQLSYTLIYDAVGQLYTDGRSHIYTQPGSTLLPSDQRLRINASCIHIYTTPAVLALRHSPLQRRATSSQVTPEYQELQVLQFESLGYNTQISMQQDTITITGSPGIGLGVHPVNATIYGPDIISSSQLAQLLNKTPGLTSINGYTGDVAIYGGASISIRTQCVGETIMLRIMPKDLDTDEQNS